MPYVKSIRGNWDQAKPTQTEQRFEIIGGDNVYTAGGYKIHEFTTPGEHQLIVRDRYAGKYNYAALTGSSIETEAFAWGAGGGGAAPQGWAYGAPGGGGGYATGTMTLNAGYTARIMVGEQGGASGQQNSPQGGGGNGTSWGNGSGGGLSGVFANDAYSWSNAIIIGGGGGGGGSSRAGTGNNGGGGGGSSGQGGYSPYQGPGGGGGSQNGGGGGSNGQGQTGGQLQGGGVSPHGGGGGGGYYGGGGGCYIEPHGMSGGGGGSGYYDGSFISAPTLSTGSARTPGNTTAPTYGGSAGFGGNVSARGNNGRVVIRYL